MKGMVSIILIVVVVIFLLLFVMGISGNWNPVAGDILGIFTFFNAVRDTITETLTVGNLMVWSLIFFAVQGVFIYAYYRLGRFIFVHIPQLQRWFNQAKEFMKTK
jgi:hypothetical protein